jgi:hypothetical protein
MIRTLEEHIQDLDVARRIYQGRAILAISQQDWTEAARLCAKSVKCAVVITQLEEYGNEQRA